MSEAVKGIAQPLVELWIVSQAAGVEGAFPGQRNGLWTSRSGPQPSHRSAS